MVMPISWSEIQSKWLYKLSISQSQNEIVEAFNRVEKRFGSSFFDDYNWLRGTYIVTLISDLDKILEETEKGSCKLPENGEVIKRIKENNIHLASTIIRLAAYYLRHNLIVEFEPEICGKKPDLRVNFNETWIYIEESKLDVSNRFKILTNLMERISSVIDTINSNLNIEVVLLKEDLNSEEIREIISKIGILSEKSSQPQALKIKDFVKITTYKKGQEKPLVEEERPALCMDALSVGSGFERHLHVQIQFTDVRMEKILKKSKQLSPKEHNLLILDLSIPGNLKIWSDSVKKILQSGKHRRLGAILLIEGHHFVKLLKVDSSLIMHPQPSKPLPNDFIKLTENCFKEFSEYQYRP